mgnify:CR=1 FL=1|jgi:hypothetical protein
MVELLNKLYLQNEISDEVRQQILKAYYNNA